MHIPDGYLGPPTSGALIAIMIPLWIAASHRVRRALHHRQAPLLAIGAAFSFVVMMFNIPIPGGTTGHAIGGVLVAILLGPWAALIAITVALVIQALLFGDGGITAIGANCFNMAVVLPFVGYGVWRLLRGPTTRNATRRTFAAGAAGYCGIVAASLFAGVEFGLQPLLHPPVNGLSHYCPFGLKIAVPAMAGQHLLIFGWIEALVTALVVNYLWAHEPELLRAGKVVADHAPRASNTRKYWILLGVLALLSPLGLLLPRLFHAGSAWGEWDAQEFRKMIGYVPQGVAKIGTLWQAPAPDYQPGGGEATGVLHLSLGYILSAMIGAAVIACVVWLLAKLLFPNKTLAKKSDFAQRSLQGALAFFKDALFAEETASQPGLLQTLDPRMKLAGILLLLLATLFARSLSVLGLLYLLCLLLAVLSRLRVGFFLLRTWLFVPLFSLAIAVPALFSFVSPGNVVASCGMLHITQPGLYAAAFFLSRVTVSVSLAVLLSLTTRHTALLRALRALGVPQIFVMVLGMCHRYIYLFVELVENTYRAIRSRTGARIHHRQGQRIVAWNIGQLWSRSHALNEQVYGAMVSRGFRGEPVSLTRVRTRLRDWLWLGGVAIICATLMILL